MRVLVLGWPSFVHGEATAGDVAAMHAVADALGTANIAHDTAWSPNFAPECPGLDDVRSTDYTDVVFVCGPVHGWQISAVHERFPHCRRIAVGVSVVDSTDPAVTGFHNILPRDGCGFEPVRDLAVGLRPADVPVAAVVLAPRQPEYRTRRKHDEVHETLRTWISQLHCAPLELDTRLDTQDAFRCSTPEQFGALIARTDVVITTRLHGLVFALRHGIPPLAVDPVQGGGKVSAQARAWHWPASITAEEVSAHGLSILDEWWTWCTATHARALALRQSRGGLKNEMIDALVERLLPSTTPEEGRAWSHRA